MKAGQWTIKPCVTSGAHYAGDAGEFVRENDLERDAGSTSIQTSKKRTPDEVRFMIVNSGTAMGCAGPFSVPEYKSDLELVLDTEAHGSSLFLAGGIIVKRRVVGKYFGLFAQLLIYTKCDLVGCYCSSS